MSNAADFRARPAPLSTCAIGSLPHTQLELAMQQALRLDILTLPQLPRSSPSEYMLPQALEGLPGLRHDAEGRTTVDRAEWERGAAKFQQRLDKALSGSGSADFEPAGFCRAWKPLLWEVEHRRLPFAKAQVAGPLTVRWATTLADGAPLSEVPQLEGQVVALVLARALSMARALRERGAQPIVFLDEPGLVAYDRQSPVHRVELEELRLAAASLHRAGALAGMHCCGNTHWPAVLSLGLDCVAIDVRLSLGLVLEAGAAFDAFEQAGGQLVLGVVPTSRLERTEPAALVEDLLDRLGPSAGRVLSRALLSPACGLALRSVAESEQVYDDLREVQRILQRARGQAPVA